MTNTTDTLKVTATHACTWLGVTVEFNAGRSVNAYADRATFEAAIA